MNAPALRTLTALILAALLALSGCKSVRVSFQPGVTNPDLQTVEIRNFYSEALDGPANVELTFTETLREYFQRNASLQQVTANGQIVIEGKISRYEVTPVAAGAGDTQSAQLQRLNVTVTVDFIDTLDENNSFDAKQFSNFADFAANQNLADVENDLIDEIFEQIVFDIFNQTVAKW